ncbi:MAG: DUF2905 domain-containing protein [Chloroflexi bacterium]|nr:DUF2905 domain-containing protein [Chloroflexota bacterium]
MEDLGRLFIYLGALFLVLGGVMWLLSRLGLSWGHLPGDIVIQREGFTCMVPIMSSLVLSLLLTLILNLLARGWPFGD